MSETGESRSSAAEEVEWAELDLRYEGCRLKQAAFEDRLLASIAARGFEQPLEGVGAGRILLNGFKRLRCARRLGLGRVPYVTLGAEEAEGIIALLRSANDRALSILEQAAFLEKLRSERGLTVAAIAGELRRSKAWVSVRLGLFTELPAGVRERLFAGSFPTYAYMYAVRPFMRINGPKEVEAFVTAVSGQSLSVREIETLAQGYFRGGAEVRAQIDAGKWALPLNRLREGQAAPVGCSAAEGALLRDLEVAQKYMLRVTRRGEEKAPSGSFQAQAQLLAGGILRRAPGFLEVIRRLHGRGR